MIFIENYRKTKVKIPKNWQYNIVNLEFKLHNRFTNKVHIFNDVQYEETEILYVLKDINVVDLPTGEYEYTLTDKKNNVVVSKGLIQIGPRDIKNTEYNYKNKYIEYGKEN